jgi:Ser/Thr protein kinase RdoA (MazF antagonist)
LWHVDQEGFHRVPLPLETRHHHGFVRHEGHLWELTPWLSGTADFAEHPSPQRLENALTALAQLHQAARSFPLAETGPAASPGIAERAARLRALVDGRLAALARAVDAPLWPDLATRAARLVALAAATARKVFEQLEAARRLNVVLQPCIRDIWRAHVLFVGDDVSGIVDFGSMRPDNVATDVARLLGSFARDDHENWQRGLSAYESVRPLADDELALVSAFDKSTVLLGGLQWLEWVYLEGRRFDNRTAVLDRVDEFLGRLEHLAQAIG